MCLDKSSWLTPAEGVHTTTLQDHFSSPRQVKMFGLRLNEASWLPLSRTGSEYILFTTMSETYGKHFFSPSPPLLMTADLLAKCFKWDYKLRSPVCIRMQDVYGYISRYNTLNFKILYYFVGSWMAMPNDMLTRIIQRALKAKVSVFRVLKWNTIRKKNVYCLGTGFF